MKIEFDKKSHSYYVDGEIAGTSVTRLLAEQKIAPNYSAVSKDYLKKKAEYGTTIHEELEKVVKNPKYVPQTKSAQNFLEYAKHNYTGATAEQVLAINWNGLIIGGTADVMAYRKDGKAEIADHKTTTFHRNYVTWQTNLLDYMARQVKEINGVPFNWKGADVFKCFCYDKNGEMTEHELEKIPDEEIEALLDCESKGEFYVPKELIIKEDLMLRFKEVELTLKQLDTDKKALQETEALLRKQIMDAMKEQGIKSYKDDNLMVTYIPARTDKVIDTDALKSKYPDIYASNLKDKRVNECLKIRVYDKGVDNE